MWVATQKLPRSPGHPFYERLNQVLENAGFDAFVEARCAWFLRRRNRATESARESVLPDAVGGVL